MKKIVCIFLSLCMIFILSSCAMFDSEVNSLNGSITGNTYECQFYSNNGNKFMTLTGQKIDINSNVIRERTYDSDGWGYVKTLSSVITITVDGHQMSNCGSTVLFVEKALLQMSISRLKALIVRQVVLGIILSLQIQSIDIRMLLVSQLQQSFRVNLVILFALSLETMCIGKYAKIFRRPLSS